MSDESNKADLAFGFLQTNERDRKPRRRGLTELRGPYYHPVGIRYLKDIFDAMASYVDILKFGGGVLPLLERDYVQRMIDLCHEHDVKVSSGGLLERVLPEGPDAVDSFLLECKSLGIDVVEVSTGMLTVPVEDIARLVERVLDHGMAPKPEVGIQFGAGGTSSTDALAAEGTTDPKWAVHKARKFLDAGAELIMIESEGITEQVREWRHDVVAHFVDEIGLDHLMFEAADPEVYAWYVKSYGPDVNLFVDHSQIMSLETLRSGTWGDSSLWGRVITYR